MGQVNAAQRKAQIRQEILLKRLAMNEVECRAKSLAIQQKLLALPEFVDRKTVAFYMSMGKEVQTSGMIRQAIGLEKRVLIPKVYREKAQFLWSEIRNIDQEVSQGTFGILEPKEHYLRVTPWKEVELVIVPGIAFDLKGRRIGFGKGYYDRMLARLEGTCLRIGLAFEVQIVPEIPQLKHDIPVQKLITEERVISCSAKEHGSVGA